MNQKFSTSQDHMKKRMDAAHATHEHEKCDADIDLSTK
jgi:hypothetical protein